VTLAAADISGVSPDSTSNAHHSKTTTASELVDVSADSNADAHHAVFEPADYTPVTTVEAHGNALAIDITGDADSVDGYEGSDLAVLAEDEVITGEWAVQDENNTGTDAVAIFNFQDANGDRTGFVGDGSQNDFDMYLGSDSGGVRLWAQGSTQLYADPSGVGIGTTSPSAPLEIDNGTNNDALKIYSAYGHIRLFETDNNTQTSFDIDVDKGRFAIAEDNPSGYHFTIQSGGNIGIGTTSPSYALEVSGDARATGEVEAFLGSDRRLKTDLDPLDSALDKVDKLTGYNFDWRNNDSVMPHKRGNTDIGVIAQEVEQVLPNAVKEFADGHSKGYKSVSYDKLVPLLIEAIKDLRKKIEN
jgi:hypothetical protein